MESWSGVWSGIYSVIDALRGKELVLIHQFLVIAYFTRHFRLIPFVSFAMCRSHNVNQDLNICFIINRQV